MVHAARRRREVAAIAAAGVIAGNGAGEEWGARLAEVPGILEAPPTTLARAVLARMLPGVSGALSAQAQARLEAAAKRIDHYGQPGDWVRLAALVIEGWAESDPGPWLDEAPYSLGALAVVLRREANLIRFGALQRRRQRLRPLAECRRRYQVKRWTADRRELDRHSPGAGRTLRKRWRDA